MLITIYFIKVSEHPKGAQGLLAVVHNAGICQEALPVEAMSIAKAQQIMVISCAYACSVCVCVCVLVCVCSFACVRVLFCMLVCMCGPFHSLSCCKRVALVIVKLWHLVFFSFSLLRT